jgi:hypothetical protein
VAELLASAGTPEAMASELFLATLSRAPRPEELRAALVVLEADRQRGAENLMWALVNSAEFLVNH